MLRSLLLEAAIYITDLEDDMDDRSVRLALVLSEALRKRGWSVYKLSKETGIPMKSTQKLVAGQSPQVSFWTVVAVAQALGVPLTKLAGTTPQAPRSPRRQRPTRTSPTT
jgi:DNA-binding Xre family transcriptional regulator